MKVEVGDRRSHTVSVGGSDSQNQTQNMFRGTRTSFSREESALSQSVCLQALVNALLSSRGGDGGVAADRRGEGRSFCEASLFNKERIRHGQKLSVCFVCQPERHVNSFFFLHSVNLFPHKLISSFRTSNCGKKNWLPFSIYSTILLVLLPFVTH